MHDIGARLRRILFLLAVAFHYAAAPVSPQTCEVEMITADMRDQMNSAPAEGPIEDLKMQVQVVGGGPPLVLVGGGLTGWRSWEPHAERLAAAHTVARVQLLNVQYGLENRPLPEGYSARMESAALAATLDELGWLDPLDLVAWSYGALITLDFALNHPERVRSLTLIEPPAVWVLPDKGMDDPDIQALQSLETNADVTAADLEKFMRAVGLVPPGTTPVELPQWSFWMEHRQSLRVGLEPLRHDDDRGRLHTFDRRVLLVTGTGTAPFLRRIIDTLAALLPQSRAIELPAGHGPHVVSMDRFLAELTEFHRGVDGSTRRDQR